jgi:hypothetical protein
VAPADPAKGLPHYIQVPSREAGAAMKVVNCQLTANLEKMPIEQ